MSAAPSIRDTPATAEAAQAGLLYERYSSKILGFCRSRLRSPEEAEDAVQHTFLNAYRSLRTGTVPRAEAAWLYKIAENVCLERSRSAWRRSRIEVVSDDGTVDGAAPEHSHDELTGLADALAQLTPNQRRAILLREWQGLSYREIAAELAITDAAVETLLFRARRTLARKLDRSRGRAWSCVNLGSGLASLKSLAGGTAAQVAAAATVVATGVAVATPALQNHAPAVAVPIGSKAPVITRSPAHVKTAVPTVMGPARGASARPAANRPRVAASGRRATPAAGKAHPRSSGARPTVASETAPPAPVPVSVPAPVPVAAPVATPPAPQPPQLPPLPRAELPPVPALPPLPPVTVPSVPVPPLPELPKLP